jgi:hypothetical protein
VLATVDAAREKSDGDVPKARHEFNCDDVCQPRQTHTGPIHGISRRIRRLDTEPSVIGRFTQLVETDALP